MQQQNRAQMPARPPAQPAEGTRRQLQVNTSFQARLQTNASAQAFRVRKVALAKDMLRRESRPRLNLRSDEATPGYHRYLGLQSRPRAKEVVDQSTLELYRA